MSPGNLDSRLWFIQPGFHMMYSAYKLNKQGDNIQQCCTPFPVCIKFVQNLYTILYKSVVPFPVLALLLDGHTDFSGDRESCLVLLSPIIHDGCDPHKVFHTLN